MNTRRTYVLDTSVLLSDPGALLRFGDSDVVLPLVVIGELEGKRDHPEIGWFARQSLRMLDDLRVRHGRLDGPLIVVSEMNEGGVLFGDGIEEDAVPFPYARRVVVGRAEEDLVLVV